MVYFIISGICFAAWCYFMYADIELPPVREIICELITGAAIALTWPIWLILSIGIAIITSGIHDPESR